MIHLARYALAAALSLPTWHAAAQGTSATQPGEATRDLLPAPKLESVPKPQSAARVLPIDDEMWALMQNRSIDPGLPCPARDSLRVVDVPYTSISGRELRGQLVVAEEVAEDIADVFERIYASGRFRFGRIQPAWKYGGSDISSMAANNTVGFLCRAVADGSKAAAHAEGMAIDVNPVTNPHVTPDRTWPRAGRAHDEERERNRRDAGLRGIIRPGDIVVRSFEEIGWNWGGNSEPPDYQHFFRDAR